MTADTNGTAVIRDPIQHELLQQQQATKGVQQQRQHQRQRQLQHTRVYLTCRSCGQSEYDFQVQLKVVQGIITYKSRVLSFRAIHCNT